MAAPASPQPAPRASLAILLTIVTLHVVLATWFALITPYRTGGVILSSASRDIQPDVGAPDERQHVNYVAHLLRGEGFPVFQPGTPDFFETYQSHQPPLFYLAEAAWAKVGGLSPDDLGQSTGRAGTWLRLLNALIGAGTVVGVYFLGVWGYRRSDVALAGAAFAALLPMNVALSGAVSNDPLLFCLSTWTLAMIARALRDGWTLSRALLVGLFAGGAFLTKTTSLALFPVLLGAILLPQVKRPGVSHIAATAAVALALPILWWLRNLHLYGDPFVLKAFQNAFSGSAQASGFIDNPQIGLIGYLVNWLGWWTVRSFFGAFGYMDIWLNETGLPMSSTPNTLYRLLLVLTLVLALAWATTGKELDKEGKSVRWLSLGFSAVVVVLFLRFGLQYFQAQARYILPAIAPISIGIGWGACTLFKQKWALAIALIVVVFGGTSTYAATRLPAEFTKRTGV